MKRALALLALAALALSTAAARADDKDALGTWDVVSNTPDGPMSSVLTLAKVEGKLKAEVDLAGAKRTVSEESLEGDVLKFKVMYEGVQYAVQGKVAKGAIEGTWEGGGNSGTLTAKKRP
jgi:hypothetical protein